MVGFDATESLTPYREEGGKGAYGAILCDAALARQVRPQWFSPEHWGEHARAVTSGGRGGAWFVEGPFGQAFLRHYLRGGLAARASRDKHLWRGSARVRSFAEFRLTRALHGDGLPVPEPIAASYLREGIFYRAAILLRRIEHARSLGERIGDADAPWEQAGRLVARFHRVGLDHADLNAHNLLFDEDGRGWMIDFDRATQRIPATGWREGNLARLERSLLKLRGQRPVEDIRRDFARLRGAYDKAWSRGY